MQRSTFDFGHSILPLWCSMSFKRLEVSPSCPTDGVGEHYAFLRIEMWWGGWRRWRMEGGLEREKENAKRGKLYWDLLIGRKKPFRISLPTQQVPCVGVALS
ncbi:hypothetical protein PM082_024202 [Marasmius tenuissimus]|nr:hypothetical protein PM082_024202 [Marasmius tenuissimus]